jgi:hypothetical protein
MNQRKNDIENMDSKRKGAFFKSQAEKINHQLFRKSEFLKNHKAIRMTKEGKNLNEIDQEPYTKEDFDNYKAIDEP